MEHWDYPLISRERLAELLTPTTEAPCWARVRELLQAGYVYGAPSAGAAEIDGPIARAIICLTPACRALGRTMCYQPFRRREPKSYVALAVCYYCGAYEEF